MYIIQQVHKQQIARRAFLPPAKPPATKHSPDNAGVVPTLGTVIGSYKSGVTRRIREMQKQPDLRVWQARYHDHIIRNETDLNRIREYTVNNPARWQQDIFYGL